MYITSPVRLVLVFLFAFESRKGGPYVRKIKIQFCITCSRGHSTGHFDAKIRCLEQFLTELLRILTFNTCNMKN